MDPRRASQSSRRPSIDPWRLVPMDKLSPLSQLIVPWACVIITINPAVQDFASGVSLHILP